MCEIASWVSSGVRGRCWGGPCSFHLLMPCLNTVSIVTMSPTWGSMRLKEWCRPAKVAVYSDEGDVSLTSYMARPLSREWTNLGKWAAYWMPKMMSMWPPTLVGGLRA